MPLSHSQYTSGARVPHTFNLMYVNDIPVDPMHNQVKISQFADDLGMWTFGPNATYVQYRIHKTFSALEKWCSNWRIKLKA